MQINLCHFIFLIEIAIRFRMAARQRILVHKKRRFCDFNWLPWQRPLVNQKRGPDRSYLNKYQSFGAEIAKIGRVDPEIICLLKVGKYVARSTT